MIWIVFGMVLFMILCTTCNLLLIGFSKMQQLRKEFQQAKSILQLMLEREQMNEVRTYMIEFIIAANQF